MKIIAIIISTVFFAVQSHAQVWTDVDFPSPIFEMEKVVYDSNLDILYVLGTFDITSQDNYLFQYQAGLWTEIAYFSSNGVNDMLIDDLGNLVVVGGFQFIQSVGPSPIQFFISERAFWNGTTWSCLLYTSPSPRDATLSRMPSSA